MSSCRTVRPRKAAVSAGSAGIRQQRFLVVGLGRAGTAMARFLISRGAVVFGFDESEDVVRSRMVNRLRRSGMRLAQDSVPRSTGWAVVSPGIGDQHPVVRKLRSLRVPVLDELDLASSLLPGPIVAVTGTNGKSTTTALIARILEEAGYRVFCGGNLAPGQPLSEALLLPAQEYYVVETSSFQLERARLLKPAVAVILNLSPDHLNRHRTMACYAESKFRILDRQDRGDIAVLNYDDQLLLPARNRGRAERCYFSMRHRVRGAYLVRKAIWFRGERLCAVSKLVLLGRHNVQNALAAVAAASALGVRAAAVRRALAAFRGLEHRLEQVAVIDGVTYVNNSMCTNPAAGAQSLAALAGAGLPGKAHRVVLIAGGREKGLPIEEYVEAMCRFAKRVMLLGESGERLGRKLTCRGFGSFDLCSDLRSAIGAARAAARPGDTVLFSPGFASFDQFADFQARGRAFRLAVKRMCPVGSGGTGCGATRD